MKWFFFGLFFVMFVSPVIAGSMVDINTADSVQIAAALDGIGQKKAEQIVAWRQAHGRFKTLEEVAAVSGIGRKLAERNKAWVMFDAVQQKESRGLRQTDSQTTVLTLPIGAYSSR